ncbi:MAG: purine-binding chemotaxis protein CheW [Lachnospiraceae bacterium]|nr:purine-binding chemotaxis protein CheW [Lachnospiraceae bacterium]
MADRKLVVFKLGEENYGVDIEIVQGIEKLLPIVRIPNSVPYIQGIINLRGIIIPVLNLRNRFSLPEVPDTDTTEFLITTVGDTMIALKVDAVDSIYDLASAQTFDTPAIVRSQETAYMKEVVLMKDKRLIIVLEANELLSSQEKAAVQKMLDQHKG